jgi:hypothetical protein
MWGKDVRDSSLYDLVIHIHRITVDDAVDIICHTVGLDHFKTTPESQKVVDDLLLAAQVKVKLVSHLPDCMVSSDSGVVYVDLKGEISQEVKLVEEVKTLAQDTAGVKDIRVHVSPIGL